MDSICICDLEVFYRVGVPEEERAEPQRLLVTITMDHDMTAAAANDNINQTIDYFAASQRLLKFGEKRTWKLIETLASDIAEMILRDFQAASVTVEVKKFIIRETRFVSVKLTR